MALSADDELLGPQVPLDRRRADDGVDLLANQVHRRHLVEPAKNLLEHRRCLGRQVGGEAPLGHLGEDPAGDLLELDPHRGSGDITGVFVVLPVEHQHDARHTELHAGKLDRVAGKHGMTIENGEEQTIDVRVYRLVDVLNRF